MDCSEVRRRLVAFVDGELSQAEHGPVRSHLERCEGCRAACEQHRAAGELLGLYEGILPREAAARAILEAVDRMRLEESPASRGGMRQGGLGLSRKPYLLAAAAVLLAAVTIGGLAWLSNPRDGAERGSPDELEIQAIVSDLELYDHLDDLLSPDVARDFDLIAADLELANDVDQEN
jgi:anti-sigma factor RsiW